jgi:hypothetical protein
VFENRVLRIFGPKRDEVIEVSRKLHNAEVHLVLLVPRMRWEKHVARRKGMHIGFLWESQNEKTPHERPSCGWDDNIKLDLREMG